MRGRVAFSLASRYEGTVPTEAEVRIRYVFLEDDRAGEECSITVTGPAEFAATDDGAETYCGPLDHEPAEFDFLSAPYDPDWSGRLVARAELISHVESSTELDESKK
ncbi:MAG: hypothetical protein M5U31_16260 [Acidimicrobiia bacterium]|nr:hypothetical protein [Acidimicrobiia bacterium]